MLASIRVIFTILVPVMLSAAGKSISDVDRAASPVKSKMAAMIAEQFVQLQLKITQHLKNTKNCTSSGITWRADISKC